MALNLKGQQKTTGKPTLFANDTIGLYAQWNGKTLAQINETEALVGLGVQNTTGGFPALVLEYGDRKVAVNFSKGFDMGILEDERLANAMFRVRRKMMNGDAEGDPTGPEQLTFGKPAGIGLVGEMKSLVETEPELQDK